jgi:hypothetical protein
MDVRDVLRCAVEHATQPRLDRVERIPYPRAGHLECLESDPVELFGQREERRVSLAPHSGNNLRGTCTHDVIARRRPLEQESSLVGRECLDRAAKPQSDRGDVCRSPCAVSDRHGINRSIRVTKIPAAPSAFSSATVR